MTAVVLLLLAGVAATAGLALWRERGPAETLVVGLAYLAIPLLTWALAPRAFTIGAGKLRVERNAWRAVEIPLARVRSVGLVPPEGVRGAIRLFGTGGLFGYYGLFRSRALGRFRLHATRGSGYVGVRTADALFVLTPERPEAFVEVLLGAAPAAVRESPSAAKA